MANNGQDSKTQEVSDVIETKHFINNEYRASKSGATFKLYNPYDESLTAEVSAAQEEDVEDAVEAAAKAQPAWAATSAAAKSDLLLKFAQVVIEHTKELGRLEGASMGVPASFFPANVAAFAGAMKLCAALTLTKAGHSSLNTPNFVNFTMRQPYGVVGAILPWNVPLTMFGLKVAPALAAGNTIVVKTSEKAPLTALYLGKLVKEVGFPPGVINIVSGLGPEAGAALARNMTIRKISFTGSARTGKIIAKAAAESNLKNVTLELGGKSPAIVFADAEITKAAKACAFSMFRNSGQICTAQSRVYVQKQVADEFIEAYTSEYKNLVKFGDVADPKTSQGPMADETQFKTVMNFIDEAKAEGKATLKMGGNRVGDKGHFIEPTVFTNVPHNARINREEVFGPVSIVHTFETEDEVIKLANDTEYGLSSSVYTKDINLALRIAIRLEAGNVSVNTLHAVALDMPFGGQKQSGVGRELGRDALEPYLEVKSVFINMA